MHATLIPNFLFIGFYKQNMFFYWSLSIIMIMTVLLMSTEFNTTQQTDILKMPSLTQDILIVRLVNITYTLIL